MEMVIALSILTVVFAFCMTAIVSLQRSVSMTDARSQAADQVRLAVQQIDREVRSGNIFYNPSCPTITTACPINFNGTGIVVFTQANGNNRCVEWEVNSGSLQSRSWTQNWQTDGSPSVVRWSTIATGITNPTSTPPFALDAASSYGGRILDIDLMTDKTNSRSAGTEIQDSVEGRNTVYGYSATACTTPWPATS